jgi:hypothetical protein
VPPHTILVPWTQSRIAGMTARAACDDGFALYFGARTGNLGNLWTIAFLDSTHQHGHLNHRMWDTVNVIRLDIHSLYCTAASRDVRQHISYCGHQEPIAFHMDDISSIRDARCLVRPRAYVAHCNCLNIGAYSQERQKVTLKRAYNMERAPRADAEPIQRNCFLLVG